MKTFAVYLPQECPDTSLPYEIETGGDVSKIPFRIGASIDEVGGRIPKTFGVQQPQECLGTPLPAWSGHPLSPKTINLSGTCQEGSSINMLTGSESNNVLQEGPVGSSMNMLTCSESNNVREESPEVANRDGDRHEGAGGGGAHGEGGGGDA